MGRSVREPINGVAVATMSPSGIATHDDGVDRQRGEETAAEVLGLAEWGGEEERIHPDRDVADRRVAEERRRDQQPEHSAEQHHGRATFIGALALTPAAPSAVASVPRTAMRNRNTA